MTIFTVFLFILLDEIEMCLLTGSRFLQVSNHNGDEFQLKNFIHLNFFSFQLVHSFVIGAFVTTKERNKYFAQHTIDEKSERI